MNRPRLFGNVAMSADGKLDSATRKGETISSTANKARLDRLRSSGDCSVMLVPLFEQATRKLMVVGGGTIFGY
jgi:riboflavin biosynthesis pyrimidine reductase